MGEPAPLFPRISALVAQVVDSGASHSFTSFEDKFVWRKIPMSVLMPMGVILSAAKNLPAGRDASLRSA
jgi:hypothetical protein